MLFRGDFIFAFIHPNLIFKDKYVTTGKKWNLLEVKYNVNDFLLSIMLFRSFYFVKLFFIVIIMGQGQIEYVK